MGRQTKKLRGGVVTLSNIQKAIELTNDLEKTLKIIQQGVEETQIPNINDVYGLERQNTDLDDFSSPTQIPMQEEFPMQMQEEVPMQEQIPNNIDYSFRDQKYKTCNSPGCTSYSFNKIIQLLNGKGMTGVVEQLNNATNSTQVKNIIKAARLQFNSRGIFGGTKKRSGKFLKKRISKRKN